jgi:hypothetical protein
MKLYGILLRYKFKNNNGYWGGCADGNGRFVGKYHTSTASCLFVMKQELTFVYVYQGVVPDILSRKFYGYPIIIPASICLPSVIILALMRPCVRVYILRKRTLDDCKSLAPGFPLTKPKYNCVECGAFRCKQSLHLRRIQPFQSLPV